MGGIAGSAAAMDWVFNYSKRNTMGECNNAQSIAGNLSEQVKKLKRQPVKAMVMYGSANVVGRLTHLGLIVEYRLIVNPVVLGGGKSLFRSESKAFLTLMEAKTFNSGVVLLRYQPPKKKS
jgi:dihydrofolate reductase